MAPSPAQIDRLLHQAVECHLAGQWEKAEALYRQILQQQPEHPDASHNLGQLWRQRGQPKAAIPLLQVAWRVNPYATQYWLSLVTALAECGEWSLLVQVLAQACATQLTQETVTALAELVSQIGDALSCNQRWTEALVVLEKGVALAPNHPAIWKSYGIALHGAGQVQAAQAAYEKALALNPHCLDAVNNLGVLAMGRRDWQAALHYFERALGIAPDHPDVWFNKAMTLKKLQRFQEAETWARRVLDARSQDPRVLRLLGEILTELRQYSEAREWLEKALGQEPDNWETLQALANHYARQERWEEAEKWARKLQDKMPDNPDVLRPLGQILLKLGREPEGLEILEKVLALKPDDVETMQALADHYARQERWEEAEKWARKLQDKMPDNPDVLRPLGQILLKLGREPEGLEILEKVLALKPDDVETMQTIYAHYNNRRHYSEAERWARKALEYRPRDPKLQQHLALILCQQDDYEEALALLDQALANGDNPLANRWAYWLGMPAVMMSREDIANWRNRFQQGMEVLMGMEGHLNWWESKPGNFFLAYHDESDRLLLEALSCLVRAKVPSVNYTAPHIAQWQMPTQRRIRVGFCSAHFRMHTISKLYQSFICELDRQRFEVFLIFAPGGQRDGISRMLEKASDQVVALEGDLSNWHQQIAQLELDVLFYPDIGMTLDTYLLAMARLAPVQCVTYGHPDTTGIDTLDYYIGGDAPMEPEGAEAHYTEHLIRMPRLPFCYQFFTLPAPSEIPPRSTLGLPETGTLYSCPQTPFKFHPDFDAVLAAIAEGDPKGHIVLIDYGKLTERLKQRWAETAPILLERVCFVPEVPLELFLGLMVHFDVVLDPIHFGSGNSFFEAMAYGKPVVTWPGRFARARLVAAAYHQMGVADIAPIARSIEEYAAVALAWGRDPDRRDWFAKQALPAAARELYADERAIRQLETFFIRALEAADRGETLPSGYRLDKIGINPSGESCSC